MRVLYVTSEVAPFAGEGALAGASAAFAASLRELGIDIRLLVPGYRVALERAERLNEIVRLGDPLNCGPVRLLETTLPQTDVPVWFVDCPALYDRAGGLYRSADGNDWPDNALRFALLNHVAAGIANEPGRSWRPDVVHCNDWQSGLIPLLLDGQIQYRPASLFTVHNPADQGLFPAETISQLDLPAEARAAMECDGSASFLKAGISMADAITTVGRAGKATLLAKHGSDSKTQISFGTRSAGLYARLYRSLTSRLTHRRFERIVVETGEAEKLTA
jgi:starch synthase